MINTCIHLFNKLGGTSIFRTNFLGKANWFELSETKGSRKGRGVCTEATNYKSIGLILTFRQLTIKRIS